MKQTLTYLALVLLFGAALTGTAQRAGGDPPRIEARLSADSISIGDQFTVDVEVEKDLVQLVDFPSFAKEDGTPGLIGERVEVLAEYPVDTLEREGRNVRIRKRYLMTIFDAGLYNLGVFPALYMDKNVTDTLYSADSLRLTVHTFPVDTLTMQIEDIAPPIEAPVLPGEWIGWALLLFLAAQLAFALVYILRHRSRMKKEGKNRRRRPDEPPHVTAIRELEKLQGEKLWQNQRHKLYYTRLTDIVREYIEARYEVGAMEMTSDEIVRTMTEINIPARSYEQIQRLLSTADYVKFAKYVPDAQDNEMSWSDAYYFVEETKLLAADPGAGKEGML